MNHDGLDYPYFKFIIPTNSYDNGNNNFFVYFNLLQFRSITVYVWSASVFNKLNNFILHACSLPLVRLLFFCAYRTDNCRHIHRWSGCRYCRLRRNRKTKNGTRHRWETFNYTFLTIHNHNNFYSIWIYETGRKAVGAPQLNGDCIVFEQTTITLGIGIVLNSIIPQIYRMQLMCNAHEIQFRCADRSPPLQFLFYLLHRFI